MTDPEQDTVPRGLLAGAGPLWMPGAERHPVGDEAPTDARYPPRVICHVTWDAVPVRHASLVRYFTDGGEGQSKAPHILWDPINGLFSQFYPATSRSKSVRDVTGGTRTNRTGRVCVQVEALLAPGKTTYQGKICNDLLDTPCKGWDRLYAWLISLGIPAVWPMGIPNWQDQRSEKTWETRGGFFGHSQVPENFHQDPGPWPPFPGAVTPANVRPADGSIDLMPDQFTALKTLIGGVSDRLAKVEVAIGKGSLASTVGRGDRVRTGWDALVDAANLDPDEIKTLNDGLLVALAPAMTDVKDRLDRIERAVLALTQAVGPT